MAAEGDKYCRFQGCQSLATKGRYCERHSSKGARTQINADLAHANAETKAEGKKLADARRRASVYVKKRGVIASMVRLLGLERYYCARCSRRVSIRLVSFWCPDCGAFVEATRACGEGKSAAVAPSSSSRGLSERDNLGTRYETQSDVDGFWIPHILNRPKFPFVFFDFREKKDAMDAMLSLPQMKIAADTGKVICTEVIQFGVYPRTAGGWGFFIAGDQINLALYDTAVASCKRHNGKNPRLGDPPKGTAVTASNAQQGKASDVTFDREEKVDSLAQMKALGIKVVGADSRPPIVATKRHFKAPNKDAAMAYLKANPVDRAHYYLVVHTPNGVFGRDKDGIYEEQH